jgi:hypothetical protein
MLNPAHIIVPNAYLQTDTVAAKRKVRYRVYEGTDSTGLMIADQTYDPSVFPAHTEITLIMDNFLELEANTQYFNRITSPAPISLKTDVTNVFPWIAADTSLVREDNLLQTKPWVAGESWTAGDYFIDSRKVYICNTTGVQTTSFASNSSKWNVLSDVGQDYWTKTGGVLKYNNGSFDTINIDADGTHINTSTGFVANVTGLGFSVYDGVQPRMFVGASQAIIIAKANGWAFNAMNNGCFMQNGGEHNAVEAMSTHTGLKSPDGSEKIVLTDTTTYVTSWDFAVDDGTRNRIRANEAHSIITSPNGTYAVVAANDEASLMDGANERVSVDATSTGMASPDMTKGVVVSNLGISMVGDVIVEDNAEIQDSLVVGTSGSYTPTNYTYLTLSRWSGDHSSTGLIFQGGGDGVDGYHTDFMIDNFWGYLRVGLTSADDKVVRFENAGAGNMHIDVVGNVQAKTLVLTNLPTSDPVDAGAVWNDNGTLKISAGS